MLGGLAPFLVPIVIGPDNLLEYILLWFLMFDLDMFTLITYLLVWLNGLVWFTVVDPADLIRHCERNYEDHRVAEEQYEETFGYFPEQLLAQYQGRN